MTATPEQYLAVLEQAGIDEESLSVVVVSGSTRTEVARALSVDLDAPAEPSSDGGGAWAIVEVVGGVVALELTGYSDPSNATLAELSRDGRSAAVTRSNIQAHERFGCARDGALVFDADEVAYVDDPDAVPAELRPLHRQAWVAPDDEDLDPEVSGLIVGLPMCEVWTGVAFTADDLRRAQASGFFAGPALVYPG